MDQLIFEARAVAYRYGGAQADAVADVSFGVRPGEVVGVVGPNGSGKTTLVRLLLGVLRPTAGAALVLGRPAAEWNRRALARVVGVVPQREEPTFPLRVREAVLFGRYPHLGALGAPRQHDRDVVARALQRADVAVLADRWVATLSGGEWQRVRVARALAQEPQALVLDEATANLDIRHEMEVFQLVSKLVHTDGLAALVVTHHVNLAARFADRLVIMDRGLARAVGTPRDVLTRETLERVFEWPVDVIDWDGAPQLIPQRKRNDS